MHPPPRLIAIDVDGTLLPTNSQTISERNARALRAAQQSGITVVIATGRRPAYTVPLLANLGLRADTPLIASNGAVLSTLGGGVIDRCHLPARVARGLCGVLRPFGSVVFTFDRPGRGELVLEDLEAAHGRIAMWVETNRNAIEVVKPLELALVDGDDPVQGMAAGKINEMREAEKALKASEWSAECESVRTEYPARDISILDLLPTGVSKGWALERLAARLGVDRKRPWPSATTGTTWVCWSGQGRESSWLTPQRSCARWQKLADGSWRRRTMKTVWHSFLKQRWRNWLPQKPARRRQKPDWLQHKYDQQIQSPKSGARRESFAWRMFFALVLTAALVCLPSQSRAASS